jgi:1-acyl-sn-glycerol-3-phosphate acyltransferase
MPKNRRSDGGQVTGLVVTVVKLISGANVRWNGAAPDTRQRVYFANHTSHLDAAVLWASLPPAVRRLTRPVAARDYWAKGVLRPYLSRIFNAILIEREKISAHDNPIDHLVEALGQANSLIIFPEGGRNLSADIGPFRSGIYHLAKRRPDLEFIPVLVDNLNRILPKGEFLAVPLLSSITFGAPIQLLPDEAKRDFLTRARAAVLSLRAT